MSLTVVGRLHDEFGSLPFSSTFDFVTDLALNGFPMYPSLHSAINGAQTRFRRFPASAATFMPDGEVPPLGALLGDIKKSVLLTSTQFGTNL